MIKVLDDNDGQMIPGDEYGPNFLTFVLQLRKSPGRNLNQETDPTGDRTLARCVRSNSVTPRSQGGPKIQELEGIVLPPHPEYSPDLAPSVYYLFRCMAHFLLARNFENIEAVEVGLTEFFASKTRDWYRREKINLAERWYKTIESDDPYFEK